MVDDMGSNHAARIRSTKEANMKLRTIGLISTLVLGLLAGPLPAKAQKAGKDTPLVGLLGQGSQSTHAGRFSALRKKMRKLGYVEGRTIRFAYRYAEGRNDRLPALAVELVRLKPDVMVTTGTPSTRAARKASHTIPIVMHAGNPVRSGLVASLARPGGNITGLTVFPGPEFYCKRLEILRETIPSARRIGVLYILNNSSHALSLKAVKICAAKIGVTILRLGARKAEDINKALAKLKSERAEGFLHFGSALIGTQMKGVIAFALKNRLPFMCTSARWIRQGCLISYGVNFHDLYRLMAIYVDKILKGAKPGDLPVEQPGKFNLEINLKTAKALGITIPADVLFRADRVIK